MTGPAPLPPELTPTALAQDWRRLDPRMLLVHPVIEAGRYLPLLIAVFFFGGTTRSNGQGSYWSVVVLIIVMARATLLWVTTRYRITATQIELRRGLLRRRTLTAALDRVRTVDVTAHALHRVLGLAKVSVGTGVSDRSGRGGLVLDGLTASSAASLRADLLHRGQPPPRAGEHSPAAVAPRSSDTAIPAADGRSTDTEDVIVTLRPAWIRFAPFTLSGAVTVVAVAGFGWRLINESGIEPERFGILRYLVPRLRRLPTWRLAVEAGLGIAAVIAIASTAGYVLAFWHFRLTRHTGGTLHVSRGLLTTRATSVEERRLRGAGLSEPALLRVAHGARVTAVATGLRVGRGAERGGTVLLPPAPRSVAVDVAGAVIGSRAPFVARLRRHGPAATQRRWTRALAAAAPVAVVGGAVTGRLAGWELGLAVAAAVVAGAALLARDRAAALGHETVDGFLVTQSGSVDRRRIALAADGTIGFVWERSFFQRRAGLVTLTATTAAGRQFYRVLDVDPAEAARIVTTLRPGLIEALLETTPHMVPSASVEPTLPAATPIVEAVQRGAESSAGAGSGEGT
ncbi:MAG: PH domain-containing protein [bacterium]